MPFITKDETVEKLTRKFKAQLIDLYIFIEDNHPLLLDLKKHGGRKMRFLGTTLIALFSVLGISSFSWAQGACMVSGLDGQATVLHDKDQPRPINKFKKIWPGDQVEIAKETTIQLNYLALGRVESWKGPALIIIEENGGHDQNNAQKPTIMDIGNLSTELKGSKLLNQQNTAGQIAIRGTRNSRYEDAPLNQQDKDKLLQIQTTYNKLLPQTSKGDVTADMYYLASLEVLGQKETMAKHIYKLLSMNGSNADLEEMLNAL